MEEEGPRGASGLEAEAGELVFGGHDGLLDVLAVGTEVPGLVELDPSAHRHGQVVEPGHQCDREQVAPLVGDLVREDRPAVVQNAIQVPVHPEDFLGVAGVMDDLVAQTVFTQDVALGQRAHAVIVENSFARGVKPLDAGTDGAELQLPVEEEEVADGDDREGQALQAEADHLPATSAQGVRLKQHEHVDERGDQDDAESPDREREQAEGGLFVLHETRHAHSFRSEPHSGAAGVTHGRASSFIIPYLCLKINTLTLAKGA